MSDRPTYQTEPREDLERRCRVFGNVIAELGAQAEESGCRCDVCRSLIAFVDRLREGRPGQPRPASGRDPA